MPNEQIFSNSKLNVLAY